MSNNPFLKPKESNNRFNFLDEDITKSSFKESSSKSNRKHINYNSSQNSFIKPERNYRDRDRRNNEFKFTPREPYFLHVKITPNIDATDTNLFPELTPIKENTVIKASTNFKDILTNVIEDEKSKLNTIPAGWAKLTSVNGKTVIEYRQKSDWIIKQEKSEEIKTQLEEPNYIMFQAIEQMKNNLDLYERNYDSIHGEGAYAERFSLPPVYGPEYDSESEEEEDEIPDEDDM
jgi:hypothetical protein